MSINKITEKGIVPNILKVSTEKNTNINYHKEANSANKAETIYDSIRQKNNEIGRNYKGTNLGKKVDIIV